MQTKYEKKHNGMEFKYLTFDSDQIYHTSSVHTPQQFLYNMHRETEQRKKAGESWR